MKKKKLKNKTPIAFAHNLRRGAGAGVHKDHLEKRYEIDDDEFEA